MLNTPRAQALAVSKPFDLTLLSADQLRTLTTELMASLDAKVKLLNQKIE